MAKVEWSFTSAELVGKPVATIGPWATRPGNPSGRKSRLASGGALKAKALLARLEKLGIR
jgi:hypothetical protein